MLSQGGGAVHGNGLDLLPEEGVDEDENTLDDISGDEVSRFLNRTKKTWEIISEKILNRNRENYFLQKRF